MINTHFNLERDGSILARLRVKHVFLQRIREFQNSYSKLEAKRKPVENGKTSEFRIGDDESLYFCNQLCVSKDLELKRDIFREAHNSTFVMYPSGKNV